MPAVKIYTTATCPYCYTLKQFLESKEIAFEEIDVTQDEKAKDELIKKTGKMEVPVVEIDGEVIVGFDKAKINKLLKIQD